MLHDKPVTFTHFGSGNSKQNNRGASIHKRMVRKDLFDRFRSSPDQQDQHHQVIYIDHEGA